MLAVILMTAACSSGSQNSPNAGPELALQARPSGVEALVHSDAGRVAPGELRATLANMVLNPGLLPGQGNPAGLPVPTGKELNTIYAERQYQPFWITAKGHFTPQGALLVDRLESAGMDGLNPADYGVKEVHAAMLQGGAAGLAMAELILSDALVRYSADLKVQKARDAGILLQAAASRDFAAYLDRLAPSDPGYARLRDALVRYNAIAMVGGWENIPVGPTLRIGDTHDRVSVLRRRLALSGDLPEDANAEIAYFDEELEQAVKRYQHRNGLDTDGAVGRRTLETMNVPVATRITQLAENLRLQRRPESRIGERAIYVNLAAYELIVLNGGREVLRSRTVIGQPGRETPRMVSELQWLEINPTWAVPRRIAAEEIVPRLRRQGTEYLEKRGFRVFDAKWREMDKAELDLAAIEGGNLPFTLRQDPGPANPLGNVKFMFPNNQAIFLHDTRQRRLFGRTKRALSHGCVRVEAADELALFLLREEGWTQAHYAKVLKSGQPHRVKLRQPIPIHIVTRTAWVEADGMVQFRNDPYGRGRNMQVASN
jgi:murein L,D-transpeptidase YcbB/YkuD